MIVLVVLTVLSVVAIAATIRALVLDGYRQRPVDPTLLPRD